MSSSQKAGSEEPASPLGGLFLPLLLITIAIFVWHNKQPAPPPEPVSHLCRYQYESLGRAVELYAHQHEGQYPESLNDLCPLILPSLPECPDKKAYRYEHAPGAFTVTCPGKHGYYGSLGSSAPEPGSAASGSDVSGSSASGSDEPGSAAGSDESGSAAAGSDQPADPGSGEPGSAAAAAGSDQPAEPGSDAPGTTGTPAPAASPRP